MKFFTKVPQTYIILTLLFLIGLTNVQAEDTTYLFDFRNVTFSNLSGDRPNKVLSYKGMRLIPESDFTFNVMEAVVYADNSGPEGFPDIPPIQFCLYTLDNLDRLDTLIQCSINTFSWAELNRGAPNNISFFFEDYLLVSGSAYAFVYGADTFDPEILDTHLGIMFRFPNRDPIPGNTSCAWFPDKTSAGCFNNQSALYAIGYRTELVECCSSVMFLPGIMGSRLYNSTDDELWVSKNDARHSLLSLNDQGDSIHNIHTKNDTQRVSDEGNEAGIVDNIDLSLLPNPNIYQSFIEDLRKWKDVEEIINDYAFIPYDWRLSLEDIVTNGKVSGDNLSYTEEQDFSESFILKKLEELQASSRTGKITIIAHSNGGLVTKALIQKLKDTSNPLYDQIDRIIFVGVPQVGTPEAVANILHGTNIGPFGFLMDKKRSRQLSENMPVMYNLLPSAGYFNTVDPAFAVGKIVSFENKPFFDPQTSQYGVFVSNETELKNYVLGTDGRTKPTYEDTVRTNIGNSELYLQAEVVHQVLDNWVPPPDTKVIQVAGWGEETLAGLDYVVKKKFLGGEYASYKPRMVIDGDATVVVPSALWMSDTNPNVERWWVDLAQYNGNDRFRTNHKDILEVLDLRDFIKSKIKGEGFINLTNIVVNNTSTLVSDRERLHYTLHSPLTLGIIDTQGRYTGQDPATKQTREEIPNVTYKQIGEVQFLSVPVGVAYTLKMQGLEKGSFSLDVDKQEGNTITDSTSFEGIPSSTSTVATMDISEGFEVGSSVLQIDKNGDGISDINLNAKLGEVVLAPYYAFSGFLQPINDTAYHSEQARSVFKGGSTIPIKFQLKNLDGVIVQASSTPVWLTPQKGSKMSASIDESTYNSQASTGTEFRWDTTSQQYIYNWSTKGLAFGYWYKLSMKLDDGNVYSVTVGLK